MDTGKSNDNKTPKLTPKSLEEIRKEQKARGLVASALERQGIDPKTVKTNDLELNVLSGKSFEDDRK